MFLACRTARRRGGFTLVEILLVLALMVAMAAVAFNSGVNDSDTRALPRVADDFRGIFAELRVRAMSDGKAYQFAYRPQSAEYAILAPGADLQTNSGDIVPGPPRFRGIDFLGPHRLPDPMTFLTVEDAPPPADAFRSDLAGDGWIVHSFASDGTSSDIAFQILDKAGYLIAIRVHGRTGRTTVDGPVQSNQRSPMSAGGAR